MLLRVTCLLDFYIGDCTHALTCMTIFLRLRATSLFYSMNFGFWILDFGSSKKKHTEVCLIERSTKVSLNCVFFIISALALYKRSKNKNHVRFESFKDS